VSGDRSTSKVHRNRFAYKASGRRLQKRQLIATLAAFLLIGLGLSLVQLTGGSGLSPALTVIILSGLVVGAVIITVIGMLSWRPARIETRHRLREGETALVVHVHDVSEQYALNEALNKMGARVKSEVAASVS
jgi:xanthosine utilization system XapX-like protein